MNKVVLTGRLAREVEHGTTGKGKDERSWANIVIAVRDGKDEEGNDRAQFLRCIIWGKGADVIKEFCDKGSLISVSGKLRNSSYEDKDGVTRYNTDVIVDDFDLLSARKFEDEEEPKAKKTNSFKKHR